MFKAKLLILMLSGSIVASFLTKGFAQEISKPTEEKDFKNVFKSNPFYTFGGWVPMTYERFISPNKSIVIGASYITNPYAPVLSVLGNSYPYKTRSGYYINPTMRFYLYKTPNQPGGFYASPEIGFIHQTKTLPSDSATKINYGNYPNYINDTVTNMAQQETITINEFQGAATIGYQAVIKNVFVIDLYFGEGFAITNTSGDIDKFYKHINDFYSHKNTPKDGSRLLAGFKIGIPF